MQHVSEMRVRNLLADTYTYVRGRVRARVWYTGKVPLLNYAVRPLLPSPTVQSSRSTHVHGAGGMGNTASNKAPDAASGAYSPTPREENVYGEYFPAPTRERYTTSSGPYGPSSLGTTSSSVSPPVPPRLGGLERRAMTMGARERNSDPQVRS